MAEKKDIFNDTDGYSTTKLILLKNEIREGGYNV